MVKVHRHAKLLKHYDRIQGILKGEFKPPVLTDVDPVNGPCNLDCKWCCQRYSREGNRERILMSEQMLSDLGPFSKKWGVKAWRIAGDTEPLLNPNIDILFQSGYDNGIDMGLITNGVLLDKPKNLGLLNFLGISLDATDREVWAKAKNSKPELFDRIISNIKKVREENPDLDISIKFVDWNNNFNHDDAKKFAEDLGCNCIIRDLIKRPDFDRCLATPLGGVFKADGSFDLCCDARGKYVLANNWDELLEIWGTEKHKELINTIIPKKCGGCAKLDLNFILQNIVQEGPDTGKSQINFI
ncbi:radical SAM protein [Candidatus Woesearchaeota archaeon]|nr:radical SAM protein [Candidatus Woesearchaeota archaeon]